MGLFVEDFAPSKLEDCLANKSALSRLKQWFLGFLVSKKQKPLLIYGPSGCGKSAAISALAKEYGANLIYVVPPADQQEAQKWKTKLEALTQSKTLFSSQVLVVFENVDGWGEEKSKTILSLFSDVFRSNSIPIIFTANDFYDPSILNIRAFCEPLQFKAPSSDEIFVLLVAISQKAKLFLAKDQLKIIAKNSKGDIRAAINDLQARNIAAAREQEKNQFELIRSIFRLQSLVEAKNLSFQLGSTADRDLLKLFLAQNIPIEFKRASEIAHAYERLSKADVFDGRIINNQYWGYLRYSNQLMLFGLASVREEKQFSYFVQYQFPEFLKQMSYSKSKRQIKKSVLLKIAKKTHTTTSKAESYLFLLAHMLKSLKNIEEHFISYYGFEEDELAFLKSYLS
ncbi:MAG: AAA family ATPase [Candidatus Micrarchaeota archaeon]|nr:AAA family ATPase [Candidatus Micrarchaeota archaeon]